jgi:hypothetical protein
MNASTGRLLPGPVACPSLAAKADKAQAVAAERSFQQPADASLDGRAFAFTAEG